MEALGEPEVDAEVEVEVVLEVEVEVGAGADDEADEEAEDEAEDEAALLFWLSSKILVASEGETVLVTVEAEITRIVTGLGTRTVFPATTVLVAVPVGVMVTVFALESAEGLAVLALVVEVLVGLALEEVLTGLAVDAVEVLTPELEVEVEVDVAVTVLVMVEVEEPSSVAVLVAVAVPAVVAVSVESPAAPRTPPVAPVFLIAEAALSSVVQESRTPSLR